MPMITTVTTTTVVTVMQSAMAIAVFGVIVLITSLVVKELLGSTQGKTRANALARHLNIVILPLFFVFTVVLAMNIWEAI